MVVLKPKPLNVDTLPKGPLPPVADRPKVFYMRHGETLSNRLGLLAGSRWDVELTDAGLNEARDAGFLIDNNRSIYSDGNGFDLVISSPLRRAKVSAVIAAISMSYPPDRVVTLDDLRERDFGALTYSSHRKLDQATPTELYWSGVEPLSEVSERLDVVNAVLAKLAVKSVLVVAHNEIGKMVQARGRGLPPEDAPSMPGLANSEIMPWPWLDAAHANTN